MSTIAMRIIEVVKAVGGNKSEFARKINLTPAYISKLDKEPNRVPSDRTISDICSVFNVSEQWLRTGEGEMFKKIDDADELEQMISAIFSSKDETIKRIIRAYWRLADNKKSAIRELIDNLVEESERASDPPAPALALADSPTAEAPLSADPVEDEDAVIKAEARKKADAYYEQLLLEASTGTSGASTPAKAG